MNEWEVRIEIAKAALRKLKKSGTIAPENQAAQMFLESYTDAISKVLKSKAGDLSKGNRTAYAKALESALCNAIKALNVNCEEQPTMALVLGKIPKKLDLLAGKDACKRAVAIEVKGSANDFDNVASGLMEFFLARSKKATIEKGELKFKAADTHFILICLYGSSNHELFNLIAKKLFPSQPARPELYCIFEENLRAIPKKKEVSLKEAIQQRAETLIDHLRKLFLSISKHSHS